MVVNENAPSLPADARAAEGFAAAVVEVVLAVVVGLPDVEQRVRDRFAGARVADRALDDELRAAFAAQVGGQRRVRAPVRPLRCTRGGVAFGKDVGGERRAGDGRSDGGEELAAREHVEMMGRVGIRGNDGMEKVL